MTVKVLFLLRHGLEVIESWDLKSMGKRPFTVQGGPRFDKKGKPQGKPLLTRSFSEEIQPV